MNLAQRLSALEASGVPTWVFDPDLFKFQWANDRALELWRSSDRAELLSRDFSDMTVSTRARMKGYVEGFRHGRSAEEQWTLYPRGEPTTLKLYFSGVELDDGRTGVLIQAFEVGAADPELLRGIEALRHTSTLVVLLDERGGFLMRNPAALRAFGGDAPFSAWFLDPEVAEAALEAARRGEVFEAEAQVRTLAGARWHAIEARPAVDAVTGAPAVLVHHTDETARRTAERAAESKSGVIEELHRALALVEEQQRQIVALSAPILDVAGGTLAVPIIGALDPRRSVELSERLTAAVVARGAGLVVLDLTGADVLDAASADQLTRMVRAIGLLGARAALTGLSPRVAAVLAERDVDLSGALILRSLRDALSARRLDRAL
jgi:anti-anti-sigma regulatory factor/PAS domain-containing protein